MASVHEAKNEYLPSFQFLINPSAGHGKYEQIIHAIDDILSHTKYQYDIKILKHKGEAISLARDAADKYSVVVAVGGDGTVNEVFNGIMGTNAILGIIPAGTGNGFALELGLPTNPREACKVLLEGNAKSIDVGKVADRYFLGTAGVGFDALISEAASKHLGPLRGMWMYFFTGAIMFFKRKPQLTNVKIDSETIQVTPLVIAIANTRRYGGTALIAPDALPDDGLLDVCIIEDMSVLRLLWHLRKLFSGKHIHLPDVSIYKGKNITISASEPIPAHVDGEAIGSYPEVIFSLMPYAIKVLVPSAYIDK